ncbi:MAG: inorganic pyrophosphatase [Clostridia bacterium]|nr:inorganic pyrophosphatase [Clostridia bacterium]
MINVIVDRPLGSKHPEFDMIYPVNYGYVAGVFAGDGEEQDAYILGVNEPVEKFCGNLIAIVHRFNDNEDKWVVAPDGMNFTPDEINNILYFQEQYFKSEILMQ